MHVKKLQKISCSQILLLLLEDISRRLRTKCQSHEVKVTGHTCPTLLVPFPQFWHRIVAVCVTTYFFYHFRPLVYV